MSQLSHHQLAQYLNELLAINSYQDYAPNGLQVEGKSTINKIVTGVTACQALLDEAVTRQADAVLVHHGYFWKGEPAPVTDMKCMRLATLLKHDINLFAYHLPLDGHRQYGNNICLAQRLDLTFEHEHPVKPGANIVMVGGNNTPTTPVDFAERISDNLSRSILHVGPDNQRLIRRVAWCTGAGQDFLPEVACQQSIDAFITGEINERTTHIARELGVHFYAAGHHATERDGIHMLGKHLAHHFKVDVEFVDIDNPV